MEYLLSHSKTLSYKGVLELYELKARNLITITFLNDV